MTVLTRHLVALVTMALGSAAVGGLLYAMNELREPPAPQRREPHAEVAVAHREKKRAEQRPRPKPRHERRATAQRRAPMPDISTPLSGLSFDLPELESGGLVGADRLLGGAAENRRLVMTEDAVDTLPTPQSRQAPQYPERARERGIEGHVVLEINVDERGDVSRVRVIEADPRGVFEDVAVAAVEKWRFRPATYQGAPVAIAVTQRIPFRLN